MGNGIAISAFAAQSVGEIMMSLREIGRYREALLELSDRFVEHSHFRKDIADVAINIFLYSRTGRRISQRYSEASQSSVQIALLQKCRPQIVSRRPVLGIL